MTKNLIYYNVSIIITLYWHCASYEVGGGIPDPPKKEVMAPPSH
jgi:hypothetical protein